MTGVQTCALPIYPIPPGSHRSIGHYRRRRTDKLIKISDTGAMHLFHPRRLSRQRCTQDAAVLFNGFRRITDVLTKVQPTGQTTGQSVRPRADTTQASRGKRFDTWMRGPVGNDPVS